MIKKLGILLLIFIATVGLSSAASAQPIATTAQGPTTYGQGGHGGSFWHWTIVRRFIVRTPIAATLFRLRMIYRPPIYRITATRLNFGRYVVTVWRRSFSPIYRGTIRSPRMIRR
jgi:hypothetical protein